MLKDTISEADVQKKFQKWIELMIQENQMLFTKIRKQEELFLEQKKQYFQNFDQMSQQLNSLVKFVNYKGADNLLDQIKKRVTTFIQ